MLTRFKQEWEDNIGPISSENDQSLADLVHR